MMALFIVLWLMNSSKQIQEAVGGYFKDPTGTARRVGSDMRGESSVVSSVAAAEGERAEASPHTVRPIEAKKP